MRRAVPVLAAVAGAVLAAVGVWFVGARQSTSFGWTAYSPLGDAAYPVFIGPPWWAVALVAMGCLALGSALTLLVVRRGR